MAIHLFAKAAPKQKSKERRRQEEKKKNALRPGMGTVEGVSYRMVTWHIQCLCIYDALLLPMSALEGVFFVLFASFCIWHLLISIFFPSVRSRRNCQYATLRFRECFTHSPCSSFLLFSFYRFSFQYLHFSERELLIIRAKW